MTVMVESVKAEEGERPKIETFDDILPYVGEASRYQWFLFTMLLPFTFVYAFLYFTQFFITLLPAEHWCTVPELERWNLTDKQNLLRSRMLRRLAIRSSAHTGAPYITRDRTTPS
ncbi:uncharacterized protein LOC143304254 isoform X3 [Bombus vancouverensis nearcticus]|uniref:uncharacterized protein LOC143304254 isoform X3 n=1 Tax=Bombus vancouverensis nearcticus TaxID=2705178 RepID=UPI00402B1202